MPFMPSLPFLTDRAFDAVSSAFEARYVSMTTPRSAYQRADDEAEDRRLLTFRAEAPRETGRVLVTAFADRVALSVLELRPVRLWTLTTRWALLPGPPVRWSLSTLLIGDMPEEADVIRLGRAEAELQNYIQESLAPHARCVTEEETAHMLELQAALRNLGRFRYNVVSARNLTPQRLPGARKDAP